MNPLVDEIHRLRKAQGTIESELTVALRKLKAESKDISHAALQIQLAYKGRCAELVKDPGCCGVPPLEIHLAQCAEPDSWVHSSFDRWVKLGLEGE